MGTAYRQRETKLAAPIAFSGSQLCETRRSFPHSTITAAAVSSNRLLTRLQFETSFNSVAAAPSALSKVHTVQFARSAEASKCTSIHPRPRPASFRSAMKRKTSSCSAIFTAGKALNRTKSSSRLRSGPQANSPITNRWQQTAPLSSSVASRLLPFLRWSIHTDVSTNGSAISCAEASGLSVLQLLQPVQSSVGLSKQIE